MVVIAAVGVTSRPLNISKQDLYMIDMFKEVLVLFQQKDERTP